MIFVNTLKMVVDLSIYFFGAEVVSAALGGKSMLVELVLLCLCYGILVSLQNYSKNRLFLLLPVLILFLPESLGLTFANRMILIAPIFYIIYLIYKDGYGLSWDRQEELFSISWKIFLGGGVLICLSGNYELFLSRCVPVAFISLVASVLLLRMLRHEPEVYLNKQYQWKNMMLLGCVLAFAWFSSRKFVLDTILNACSFIYTHCILPVFTFFITCFVAVLELCMKLFSWIKFGEFELQENDVKSSEGVNPFSDLEQTMHSESEVFKIVLSVIVILLLIVAAFFFFRWLAGNRASEHTKSQDLDISRTPETVSDRKREYTSTTAHQIRRQYRKFLKLYQAHGKQISPSDTSADIAQRSGEIWEISNELEEMKEIYRKARYGNQATRADLKRMKQINQGLK